MKYLTAVLREAWTTLPESSSRPLLATLAQSRNLAHASLETAVPRFSSVGTVGKLVVDTYRRYRKLILK